LFADKKIVGVKMFPGYQYFYPYDHVVHPVAELCMEYRKPLMFHTGDCSARGKPLLRYAHPIHVDDLAARYPELKIVVAHFGFPYILEAANVANKSRNVFIDISGTIDCQQSAHRLSKLQDAYTRDIARALAYFPNIEQKIMFGTDFGGEQTQLNQF